MLPDEILYYGRKFGFVGQRDAFGYMAGHHPGALNGIERVVRIHAVLIFSIESRILDFADIVVESAGAHELYIGADAVGGRRREVAHRHGVLESAGTLFGKFAQKRVIDVRQFHERDSRGEAETALEQEHKNIAERDKYSIYSEIAEHPGRYPLNGAAMDNLDCHITESVGQKDERCGADKLRAAREVFERRNGHHTCHGLKENEFEGKRCDERAGEHLDEIAHECGAGVEKHLQHNRQNGKRHEVKAAVGKPGVECERKQREDGYQREYQADGA